MPTTPWPWATLLPDPRPWVLTSDDPAARWALLTGVLDRPDGDPDVLAARAEMLAHPSTADLLARLEPWDSGAPLSGHNQPSFAPNLLTLLADRGLRTGDHRAVDAVLAQMTQHADDAGRLQSFASPRRGEPAVWGTLLCDNHATIDVLLRYGADPTEPAVARALAAMAADLADTAQGRAWPCRPDPATAWRGPGRRRDFCPQVTLEALRAFSRLPDAARPPGLLEVARVALHAWVRRGVDKPYMFGHGQTFKTSKWPVTWYCAQLVVDVLGRFPQLRRPPDADPADRRALAELAACLVAYNTDDAGRVVPRSVYRGFETHSLGQKRQPSALATALFLGVLHRVDDLAPDAAAVDVTALARLEGRRRRGPAARAGRRPALTRRPTTFGPDPSSDDVQPFPAHAARVCDGRRTPRDRGTVGAVGAVPGRPRGEESR